MLLFGTYKQYVVTEYLPLQDLKQLLQTRQFSETEQLNMYVSEMCGWLNGRKEDKGFMHCVLCVLESKGLYQECHMLVKRESFIET